MAASSWSKRDTLVTIIWTLILAGVTLLLNLRWSPVYQALEADSGVYAYVGSAILEGQLPYRDVWEHKPPVGFYLNALALAMFGHNPWAIWWFNVIWVAITTMVFFLLIRKMMGTLTGCLASLFFLTGVMVPELFQGGNLMEVYGLLPQVLLIAAVYQFFSKQKERWIFAAGLLTGIAFLTKQTTIALGLSSILAIFMVSLLRREFKHALLRPFLFSGGVIAPIVLASSYWLINGAVYDFLDAVFLHSLAYVGERASFLWSLKNTFLSIFPKLTISRLYYIAFGSFILYCFENFHWFVACLHRDRNSQPVDAHPVELTMLAVFIALPLEIAFASLGARNFGHYFLTLIPAGITVAAYIIWKTFNGVNAIIGTKKISSLLSVVWFLLFIALSWWLRIVVFQCAPNTDQLASINKILGSHYEISEMEQHIIDTTKPGDRVLVWHIHTGVNFITQRQAAAQVLFPMNLFIGNSKMPDFVTQMTSNPPELIVFQKPSSIGMPFVDENIDEWCESGCMPEIATGLEQPPVRESLIKFQKFFQQHYILDVQIHDWYIYRYLK
jgi:hypothetical protein